MIIKHKLYQILFLFLLVGCHVSQASSNFYTQYQLAREEDEKEYLPRQELMLEQTHVLGQRPPEVQQEVDRAFNSLSMNFGWGFYNGKKEFYNLMNLDEKKLLKKLAFQDNGKDEVYILDAGCSHGGWGEMVVEFLETECSNSRKKFHIFSVTGGLEQCILSDSIPGKIEQKDRLYQNGNITHYRYNEFKLEEIDMAFKLKGHANLTFDLIVSRSALMHCADPFGTLSQLYNLLDPSGGMLLANGFWFAYEDTNEGYLELTDDHFNLFAQSSAISLFCACNTGTQLNHFILVRTNNKPLNLPIDYTNQVIHMKNSQCASQVLTVFKKSPNVSKQQKDTFKLILPERKNRDFSTFYCEENDKNAQALMHHLVDQQIFIKPVKIKTTSDILDDSWESDSEVDLK